MNRAMRIVITGGAGYVGSHAVARLQSAGYSPFVIDDLSAGHADALAPGIPLFRADIRDSAALCQIFAEVKPVAVMHFAGVTSVAASVRAPLHYFDQNVVGSVRLLETMLAARVSRFVFSSSAAVYGNPESWPIQEDARKQPESPYGENKWAVEQLLARLFQASGLSSVSLRYFNAAGAAEDLCERHQPETHLIPLAIDAASGRGPAVTVFGTDYPTPDGTAVRDYVHVSDLAEAHLAALNQTASVPGVHAFNIGAGRGHSVREVLAAVADALGTPVPSAEGPRRAGDPAVLVADIERAQRALQFSPKSSTLHQIVHDAVRSRTALGPTRES
jgi:UDP-glucose-4-epimerase GalE